MAQAPRLAGTGREQSVVVPSSKCETSGLEHPGLQNLRRIGLATRDAHGLYAELGFTPLSRPENQMEKRSPRPSYLKSTPA